MTPRNGRAIPRVETAPVKKAKEAASAEPGSAATGDAGSDPAERRPDPLKAGWIEIKLIDNSGAPVPGERYRVTAPDGGTRSGTLDHEGFARVEGIDPGTCQVAFPRLDSEAWEPA